MIHDPDEIVFGVYYGAEDFASIHFGAYWQSIRDRFPEMPLDRPPIETGYQLPNSPGLLPDLRRVYFQDRNNDLIQLQSNCFLYNNKLPANFTIGHLRFCAEWAHFQSWWQDIGGKPLCLFEYTLSFYWILPAIKVKMFDLFPGLIAFSSPIKSACMNLVFDLNVDGDILQLNIDPRHTSKIDEALMIEITARHTVRTSGSQLPMEEWFCKVKEKGIDPFIDHIFKSVLQ